MLRFICLYLQLEYWPKDSGVRVRVCVCALYDFKYNFNSMFKLNEMSTYCCDDVEHNRIKIIYIITI